MARVRHDAQSLRLLSRLLDEITELAPDRRAAWLNALSGESARLRPALEKLLERQAGTELEDFLERPAQIAPAEAPPGGSDLAEGDSIGPYRLLRLLGRGGMGEVWLAATADGLLKRKVALKLPVLSVRRSLLAQRFARERDILAALIHPHIARLYDAGIADDGQPYMALEYVQGTPITEAAQTLDLDAAGRVRLLRQVMDAVQYAHANLVIHRDLKPANVLVTPEGQAKLLDFGIAKLVEAQADAPADSDLTRLAGRALTLRYAAPELIRGSAVSTAVDIWALGVLLYELLCGARPFNGDGPRIEQQILDRDPLPPSQARAAAGGPHGAITRLSRSLAADLDTITLKALKKQPAERYATVAAFADDLDRWLRGEPVSARPDSAWYRARRFAERHRWALMAFTLAAAAVLGAGSVAVVQGLRASEEGRRAVAARDFMSDVFLQTDRDLSPGGQDITGKALLAAGYQRVLQTMQDQPLLQADLLLGIGDALDFMEDLVRADQAFEGAAQALQRAGRPVEAAQAALTRATLRYYNRWDIAGAAPLMARALAMHPAPADDAAFMARYAIYRSVGAEIEGDFNAERAWHERALPYASQTFTDNSTRTVMAVRTLSRVDAKYGAAERGSARLNALLERLKQDRRARPAWVVGVLDDLGQIEFSAGRYRAAMQRFDAGDAYCREASDPRGIQCLYTQFQRARTMMRLGDAQRALETVPLLLDTTRISPNSAALAARFTLRAYQVLGANGQLDRHPELAARVRQLGQAGGDDQWQERLNVLLVQGKLAAAQGRSQGAQAAQAMLQQIQALLARRGARAADFPEASLLEGLVDQLLGKPAAALAALERAHDSQRLQTGADHPQTQLMSVHRARALWALGRRDEALAVIDRALPILRPAMGDQAPCLRQLDALRTELAASPAPAAAAAPRVELFL